MACVRVADGVLYCSLPSHSLASDSMTSFLPVLIWFVFFFQAEDGIRDDLVTGVQTCALPIWQKWNLGLLNNMARPGGAWVTDALLGDQEYTSLKREIKAKFGGPRNAGETAILHGGVKWQSMSMSPMELDWIESDNKSDRDIAGIFFNFPLFLLGLADSTYSNQEEARYALYTEIELPLLDMFEGSLNMWLPPRYGGYLGYDPKDIEAIQRRLQEAQGLASDRATAEFTASTTTFHEAREIQGKKPLPCKDFVIINSIPVHGEDLYDYIAARTGERIHRPAPPPMLPPPTTI